MTNFFNRFLGALRVFFGQATVSDSASAWFTVAKNAESLAQHHIDEAIRFLREHGENTVLAHGESFARREGALASPCSQEDIARLRQRMQCVLDQHRYQEKFESVLARIVDVQMRYSTSIPGSRASYLNLLAKQKPITEYLLGDLGALWRNRTFIDTLNNSVGGSCFALPS